MQISNLTFKFDDKSENILNNIEFAVNKGEIILLVGPSGSGKSTLASILTGFYPENGGIILENYSFKFANEEIKDLKPQQRVKYICQSFQNVNSYFSMDTLRKEMIFTLENMAYEREKIDEKISEIAIKNNVLEFLDQNIYSLSMGEKQRASFCVLDLIDSDIYILDEPFANLDEINMRLLQDEIIEKVKLGKSYIIIDHNFEVWNNIVDKTFLLTKTGYLIKNPTKNQLEKENILGKLDNIYHLDELNDKKELIRFENFSLYAQKNVIEKKWYEKKIKNPKLLIDNVNCVIFENRLTALSGQSGIGKTTLFQTLLKEHDYKGNIFIEETEVRNYTEEDLYNKIGLVFQNPSIQFVTVKVLNEINIGIYNIDISRNILDELDLLNKEELSPFLLSEGQKRRLAVMCMISGDKKILLIDEPTYGQDIENAKKIMNNLKELTKKGVSVIYTTHDKRMIDYYADDIIYFENKKLFRRTVI